MPSQPVRLHQGERTRHPSVILYEVATKVLFCQTAAVVMWAIPWTYIRGRRSVVLKWASTEMTVVNVHLPPCRQQDK